ncbi:hypothetical protein PMAYCL1PPCAC_22415, partial [Pristionchus mayeri]
HCSRSLSQSYALIALLLVHYLIRLVDITLSAVVHRTRVQLEVVVVLGDLFQRDTHLHSQFGERGTIVRQQLPARIHHGEPVISAIIRSIHSTTALESIENLGGGPVRVGITAQCDDLEE